MKVDLKQGWRLLWRDLQVGPEHVCEVLAAEDYLPAGDLPCDAHMPLMAAGIIQDPVEADNSYACEWMERKSWWFRKDFIVTAQQLQKRALRLVLESLDLYADIFLNGRPIGSHSSCHYPFVAAVKDTLQEGENTLLVRLTCGPERISREQLDPLLDYICTESDEHRGDRGEKARAFLRKPQYAFGWDWGPRVATVGIMKGAYLELLEDVAPVSLHPVTLRAGQDARMRFEVTFESLLPVSTQEVEVGLSVWDGDAEVLRESRQVLAQSGLNYVDIEAILPAVRLWWPNGAGAQPLYTAQVELRCGACAVQGEAVRFGVRTIRLNMQPDAGGRRFAIEVNGIPIYCKGGNWIPADSLYARVTPEKYRTLVTEARACNFNMLRVWGGGLYEQDVFYEACDEQGILIWHDFMFACALYPDEDDRFRQLAVRELDYQTRRLRTHPCMALWCGNNENQWLFEDLLDGAQPHKPSGGLTLYHQLMPQIVRANCPEIPYWRSSPYGGTLPNDNEVGDRHHWRDCTMHAEMARRITPEEYDKVTSRFVSEYGYIGPCSEETIQRYYGGKPVVRGDAIWNLHNNTFEKATVPEGIRKHYADPESLSQAAYLQYARLVQGLMYGYSMEAIRYCPHNDGCLFWMYNDTWGEVGWSIVDYYLDRKPAYYYVRRAFAPVRFILRQEKGLVQVLGVNDTDGTLSLTLEYGYASFSGAYDTRTVSVRLPAFEKGIVHTFAMPTQDLRSGLVFVRAEGMPAFLLRTRPFRDYAAAESRVSVEQVQREGPDVLVHLHSSGYSHAVSLALPASVRMEDAFFDMLPGERRTIRVYGKAGEMDDMVWQPVFLSPGMPPHP